MFYFVFLSTNIYVYIYYLIENIGLIINMHIQLTITYVTQKQNAQDCCYLIKPKIKITCMFKLSSHNDIIIVFTTFYSSQISSNLCRKIVPMS